MSVKAVYSAIANLQRLSELFQERRTQLAEQVGLTEQQWKVLEEISTEHFIPSMFAKHRDSSQAAVSKILRQLKEKKLITVSVSSLDGRQRKYILSARGGRVMKELRERREHAIATVWMDLEPRDLVAFNRLSEELIQRLEAYARALPARDELQESCHG